MTDEQHPLPHHRREPETEAPAAEPQTQAETPPAQPQSFKDLAPWEGEATIVDKLLLVGVFGVPLFYLVLLPFRPQLIANHPVLLEFLTGAKSAIVGAGAYAGIGELSLTLVFIAGLVGMAKFDWMFWLAGRRWGDGAVNLFAQSERQRKRFSKLKNLPAWLLFIFVFISRAAAVPHRPDLRRSSHDCGLDGPGLQPGAGRRRRHPGHRPLRDVDLAGDHRRHRRVVDSQERAHRIQARQGSR